MSSAAATETRAEAAPVKLALAYDDKIHDQYEYSQYLPVYDEETSLPPLQPFGFYDRGLAADRDKPNLLPKDNPGIKATKLTPVIGTEIRGLQLSRLDGRQKDELALLIAERGVVVFRDQGFKDIGAEKQKEFGRSFGPLHIHPVGAHVRREPVKSEHPIVRIHPATGQKALFVNPGFTKRIIGLRDEESDALLKLLFRHISHGQDFQVCVKWEEGTVALWDNHVTAHTAISDYNVHNPQEGLRHGFRITALADKPTDVNGLASTW
ncbi:Clavaminate synthase-like protein [Colletotrichum somersetense]|nr:Clavaminate synthase-like protein [Colletotrichum somersetense]